MNACSGGLLELVAWNATATPPTTPTASAHVHVFAMRRECFPAATGADRRLLLLILDVASAHGSVPPKVASLNGQNGARIALSTI
jgi:hypothetical protein